MEEIRNKAQEHANTNGHTVRVSGNYARCTSCNWFVFLDPKTGNTIEEGGDGER